MQTGLKGEHGLSFRSRSEVSNKHLRVCEPQLRQDHQLWVGELELGAQDGRRLIHPWTLCRHHPYNTYCLLLYQEKEEEKGGHLQIKEGPLSLHIQEA